MSLLLHVHLLNKSLWVRLPEGLVNVFIHRICEKRAFSVHQFLFSSFSRVQISLLDILGRSSRWCFFLLGLFKSTYLHALVAEAFLLCTLDARLAEALLSFDCSAQQTLTLDWLRILIAH